MKPTSNLEQEYYTANDFDHSDYCFENEDYPSLKIVKVETLVDRRVS